jgi:hypothetical protein
MNLYVAGCWQLLQLMAGRGPCSGLGPLARARHAGLRAMRNPQIIGDVIGDVAK